jgi:hypothetical protein
LAQRNPTLRRVGFIIFSISIILAVFLILVRAVPDLEASMYGFIQYNYPKLSSLRCPMLMTTLDREPVTVRLKNPLDRSLSWYVDTQFSPNIVTTDTSERFDLPPGGSKVLSWEVDQSNIDLGNFILARTFASSSSDLPMREATCGTLVLNLPFKGGPVIFYAILVLCVIAAALGLFLWSRNYNVTDPGAVSQTWWMRFMAIVLAVGIITAMLNNWFLALVMVFLALLATGVFLIPRKV